MARPLVMPNVELLICDSCRHEKFRPLDSRMTLPCKCGNREWEVWEVVRGKRKNNVTAGKLPQMA